MKKYRIPKQTVHVEINPGLCEFKLEIVFKSNIYTQAKDRYKIKYGD